MIFNARTGILTDGVGGSALFSRNQALLVSAVIASYPSHASYVSIANVVWDGKPRPPKIVPQIQLLVHQIRKKLDLAGMAPLITNILGQGFKATCAVRQERGSKANLLRGDDNQIGAAELAVIAAMGCAGARYSEIREATGRPLGTVKTAMRRLRLGGIVPKRYAGWVSLDA